MRKIMFFFLLFLLFAKITSFAQNLVLNPSFENYWKKQLFLKYVEDTFYCKNWSHIFLFKHSTVDYYNNQVDSSINNIDIDIDIDNVRKKYRAFSGASFVGLGLFFMSPDLGMEHLTGTLNSTLEGGKEYEFTFYLQYVPEISKVFSTKIEVAFLNEPYSKYYMNDLVDYAHIFKNKKIEPDFAFDIAELQDSSGWVKFSKKYIARGDENFFCIGIFYQGDKISKEIISSLKAYFFDLPESTKNKKLRRLTRKVPFIKVNPNYTKSKKEKPMVEHFAYYLIDDVSVVPVK